ncbi:MAG TPA: NERD domain-containing protein [Candidatus Aminicenantes bacterium]|nr:NERD domain-containing protein [Candidatus Aminicenantes bacterium]
MKNKAEEFVFHICRGTFLSLWTYANPRGKKNKELCDILAACGPDIIIFSVKEIQVSESSDIETVWKRWNRRAVKESAKQVYGAERWLKSAPHVIKKDGGQGLGLPSKNDQKIHRIVVALGGKDKVPIFYGDFGKGFVHVFDEISFDIILQELDTISDFIKYLTAKERFYMAGKKTPFLAGEENLLALYLHSGRKLPEKYTAVLMEGEMWDSFVKKPEYLRKKEEDKISYFWDDVIEDIAKYVLKGNLEFSSSPDDGEIILRIMAREERFSRRILGKLFAEFIHLSSENKVRSRMLRSPSGIIYVLLALPHTVDRKYRCAELGSRCFITRGQNLDFKTVIGIATEISKPGVGHSFDLYYLYLPNWTEEHQKQMELLQKETGFFVNPVRAEAHEDEYPQE